MASPSPPPPTGPTGMATVPPDSAGIKTRGTVLATIGLKALVAALGLVGPTTEEGVALAKAIATLGKVFGDAEPDLQREEVKMLAERIPAAPQPSPQQGAAFADTIRKMNLAKGVGRPMPGAAQGGA